MTARIPRSEDEILAILDEHFPLAHPALRLGRGDDCAVIPAGGERAVTCDVFLEDAHFRSRYFSPADIGHKALAVNISDLAAQGARPEAFVLGLTLRGDEDADWLRAFAQGMADLAARFGLALAGGDLARSPVRHISITAWGAQENPPLLRGVAREGDLVFVAGALGLARTGLCLLEAAAPENVEAVKQRWPAACAAHLRPEPRVADGLALARLNAGDAGTGITGTGSAGTGPGDAGRIGLMDVSDGLARDLPRLLASGRTGLGADLALPASSLPDEVLRYAADLGAMADAARFAWEGGEDYALAGTCPPELWPAVQKALASPPLLLGTVRRGPFTLNGAACGAGGFDHFTKRPRS